MISTMPVNFVPAPRRISRQRQSCTKLWIAITCAYSVVLAVVFVGYQSMAGAAVENVDNELAMVNSDIQSTQKQISEVTPTLNESRLTLQASRAVGNQPDWSVLMALLASRLNERVVLSHCSLTPQNSETTVSTTVPRIGGGRASPQDANTKSGPTHFNLDVRGLAKTQASLSTFVLELEQAGLFAKVVLQDAQRVEFVKGEAIQFQIVCTLQGEEVAR